MLKVLLVLLILLAIAAPGIISYIYGENTELEQYFASAVEVMEKPVFIIAVLTLGVLMIVIMRVTHMSRKTVMEKRKMLKKKVLGK